MKLKRVPNISFTGFKKLLVFSALLLTNFLSAQLVSISSIDLNAAEVTAPGAQNLASFTISRPGGTLSTPQVIYTVTGTATSGTDHDLTSGSVILPITISGVDSEVTVGINTITDDLIVEGIETIIVTLTSVNSTGVINPAANEITINVADNDTGEITLDLDEMVINGYRPEAFEGGQSGQFRIQSTKTNGTGQELTVNFTITGTSTPGPGAGAGFDHDLTGTGSINATKDGVLFPDGTFARNINVVPFDDAVSESDKTVIITLTSTSDPTNFTIGTPNTATVTIIDNDCAAGDTAPTLNANPTTLCDVVGVNLNTFVSSTAPSGSTLSWATVANPTEGQLLTGTAITSAASGTYYTLYTFGTGVSFCSSPSTQLDITLNTAPTAGNDANGSACNNSNDSFGATLIDLDDLLSGGVSSGDWDFVSGPETLNPNGLNRVQFSNRTAGTYVYSYTTTSAVAPCTNDSATFTITVADCDPCEAGNTAPAQSGGVPVTFCGPITTSLDDYAPNSGPNSTVLRWATSQLTAPVVAANFIANGSAAENNPLAGTYYGYYFDATNSCVSPALEITLLSNPIPSITNVTDGERCGSGVVVLSASVSIGATINWYSALTGGTLEGTGANFSPNLSQSTTYYVEATLNGCESVSRQAVVATVVPQPSAGIAQNGGNASSCSDPDNGPTTVDLDELISGEDVGEWVYDNGPLPGFVIPSGNTIDFEGRPDGSYVFTFTTTGAQAPCLNESSSITISVNDCDVDTDLDGLFDGPESTLGTDPNNPDTDGDGLNDGTEVGGDVENPIDTDDDGIIDALDSNIEDADLDGVVDQLDPANENPCIPVRQNGVCDFDNDGITDSDEIANDSDPDDPCDPDPENGACNAEVDLEVLKTVDNINGLVGETVVFTITINNLSTTNTASSIIIGDLLESGFEYVSHSPEVEPYDPNTGEWSIPLIGPGASEVIEITVNIVEGGTYTNTAELLDVFQTDTNASNDKSETITLPIKIPEGIDLVIEKTALSANPLINEEVIFTIKVINASIDEAPVNNIEVSDVIDANAFIYVSDNTDFGAYNNVSGIWSIPSINKGQEVILTIRVRVPNEGTFANTASIVRSSPTDGNLENNEASVVVTVSAPTPADVGFLFNEFSPNGDGTNDMLIINRIDQETNQEVTIVYNIQIFNRYGNLMFEASNKSDSEVWDGSWKGKEAPGGTYFYTMNIDVGDGSKIRKGWIQLIR